MKYDAITYEQAKTIPEMFYPTVLTEKDANQYWYFCASDNRGLCGAAAVAPQKQVSTLKSIAVSPAAQREGVGIGLIHHIRKELAAQDVPRLTVTASLPVGQWDILDSFFQAAGFSQHGYSAPYYQATMAEIIKLPYLQEMPPILVKNFIRPLSQVPSYVLAKFFDKLHKTQLVDPSIFQDCNRDMSYVAFEKDNLLACCLLSEDGQNGIECIWAYQQKETPQRALLIVCLGKAILDWAPKFQPDTLVWSLCLNPASNQLMQNLWGNATASSHLRTYHCGTEPEAYHWNYPLPIPGELPANWVSPSQDPEDFQPTLDDGTDTVCAHCKMAIPGKLLSCKVYSAKPGSVIYGENCPKFKP